MFSENVFIFVERDRENRSGVYERTWNSKRLWEEKVYLDLELNEPKWQLPDDYYAVMVGPWSRTVEEYDTLFTWTIFSANLIVQWRGLI